MGAGLMAGEIGVRETKNVGEMEFPHYSALDMAQATVQTGKRVVLLSERDGGCMPAPMLIWHVAEVEPAPRAASLARQSILAAGYQCLAPQVREAVRLPRDQRATVLRPLWPGYLLMGRTPDQDWSAVYRARGVSGLLHLAGDSYSPAVMPAEVIDWLMANMSQTGVVEPLSVPPTLPPLPTGAPVRMLAGALAGHSGIVEASKDQRVIVLLKIMGRVVKTTAARHQVETQP